MSLPKAYLLDIEGTTTPIDFVTRTLFPYARVHLLSFIQSYTGDAVLMGDMAWLSNEYREDLKKGHPLPDWSHMPDPAGAIDYLYWLMDRDRKSRALKSIQGRIWEEGYIKGELKGEIYEDVEPAIRRWKARGCSVYIYSSGSVLAQKLIFGNLPQGSLLDLLDGHFDTEVGPKKEAASYRAIAKRTGHDPSVIRFLSDSKEEVEAARACGIDSLLVARDASPTDDQTIIDFSDLT